MEYQTTPSIILHLTPCGGRGMLPVTFFNLGEWGRMEYKRPVKRQIATSPKENTQFSKFLEHTHTSLPITIYLFFLFSCLLFSINRCSLSPPLSPSLPSPCPTLGLPQTVVCTHGLCIHAYIFLVNLPSNSTPTPTSKICQPIPCILVSGPKISEHCHSP